MTSAVSARAAEASDVRRKDLRAVLLLVLGLIVVYHANLTVLDEGDAVPNINQPLTLLETGGLSFDAEHFPEMFKWRGRPPLAPIDDTYFVSWDERLGAKTPRQWRSSGHLELNGPRYYIVESPRRHVYVSTFGPLPGLLFLPVIAPFYAIDHDLSAKLPLKTSLAKLEASMFVAATAALLFLIARRRTTHRRALLVALVYGVGSCAWAISSQNLWQQTVNQLFLTLGAYFLLGDVERRSVAALSGFAFGAATACRATGLIVFALAAIYLYIHHRRSVAAFLLACLPVPLLIGIHNHYYFGSPFTFAQQLVGHMIAQEKTGSPSLWQTPLYRGALGLLFSPSRGLVMFSPILLPAFWGAFRIFRDARWQAMRPLALASLLTMAAQCKWFDWWGGWAYGYRPWLDVVPYLTLFLVPVINELVETKARRALFAAALGWSAAVQAIGALSYDRLWNRRTLYVTRVPNSKKPVAFTEEDAARRFADSQNGRYLGPTICDIDFDFCRHRLWSIGDSVVLYQLTHFRESRSRRMPMGWNTLGRH